MLRAVLKAGTTPSDALALSSGLVWDYQGKYSTPYSQELQFVNWDGSCLVKFVDDIVAGVQYLILSADTGDGTPPETLRGIEQATLAEILQRPGAVTLQSWDALRAELEQTTAPAARADLLLRLALAAGDGAAGDYDPARLEFFVQQLSQDEPLSAQAIILGAGYMGWTQWEGVLQQFAQATAHADLRASAKRMLSSFQAQQ